MSKQVNRRKFLKEGVAGSLVALASSKQLRVGAIWAEVEKAQGAERPLVLSATHRKLLRAAADEIIPAADGCLAATEAGAVDYVEVLLEKAPELQKQIQAGLTRLDKLTRLRFRQPFEQLTSAQRVKLLQLFEDESMKSGTGESLYSASGNLFATLRDLVYEGYYTSPKVWPQLGYEFHGTDRIGPDMQPFDESILAQVRSRPENYRKVK